MSNELKKELEDISNLLEEFKIGKTSSSNLVNRIIELTVTNPELKPVFDLLLLIESNKDTDFKVLTTTISKIMYRMIRYNENLIEELESKKESADFGSILSIIPRKGVSQILFYVVLVCLLLIVLSLLGSDPVAVINTIKPK